MHLHMYTYMPMYRCSYVHVHTTIHVSFKYRNNYRDNSTFGPQCACTTDTRMHLTLRHHMLFGQVRKPAFNTCREIRAPARTMIPCGSVQRLKGGPDTPGVLSEITDKPNV